MNDKTQYDTDDALAKAVVDRLSTDVDPEVAARLRAARQEAVYLVDSAHRNRAPCLAPAGGRAAAAVVAAGLLREPGMQPMPVLDDAEMAARD